MKVFLLLIFIAVYQQTYGQISSQDPSEKYSEIFQYTIDKYGIDQQLVSGRFYENKYTKAIGHPFLLEDKFYDVSVIVNGLNYSHITARYDIYEQLLVIKAPHKGFPLNLHKEMEFVSEFIIDDRLFRKYSFVKEKPAYYQLVAKSGELSCLYYWFKNRSDSYHNGPLASYRFTESKYRSYLLINGERHAYKNNFSFRNVFPKVLRKEIQTYLKSRKLKLKSTTDEEMVELIRFCDKLLKSKTL